MSVLTARGQCGIGQSSKLNQAWKVNLIQNLYGKVICTGLTKQYNYVSEKNKARKGDHALLKLQRRNNKFAVKCQGEDFKIYPFDEKDYIKVQLNLFHSQNQQFSLLLVVFNKQTKINNKFLKQQ
eukprot:TRINITY_DN6979_c0_g1_i2.p1 TRINITY_DN6979_c0_g1~~TRINITY_DN6979_c0_g1_i2.p1  ORF type:complete len:125 (+),score=1.02 TRINITY_DN6979_c0_g1_i2:176-550(+)